MQYHNITIQDGQLATICRAYRVSQLWLFGSILRQDFGSESDVDVLVQLQQPIGLFRLGGLEADLTDLFGRRVHLTSFSTVPEEEKPELLRSARLQYAA